MKALIFGVLFAASASAVAMDAPSTFVSKTLTSGQQIMTLKSQSAQVSQLCALINQSIDVQSVGMGLLGSYADTSTDKAGVDTFIKLVPSILVTKLSPMFSQASSGSFTVGDTATDNGDGTYSVDVTVTTSQGTYDGEAIVEASGNSFLIVDAQYLGFSAVSYFGQDIQNQISTASQTDAQTPVSDTDKSLASASGFIQCP